MKDFIKSMPKIDLHLHLDGAVRTSTIIDLARKQNYTLPTYDEEDLEKLVQVSSESKSLTDFLNTFEIFYPLLKTQESLERVAYELALDLKQDNVIYAEIRFAPVLNIEHDVSSESSDPIRKKKMREMVQAVIRGWDRGKKETSIKGGIILCAYRGQSASSALETIEIIKELKDGFKTKDVSCPIYGADLAGDESHFEASLYKEAFDYAHKNNIPVTVHAAEAASWESARDAIDILHAKRIGHGIRIKENDNLFKIIKEKQIPLEVCLTSNVQTATVSSLSDHPFPEYLREGLAVTINTDDPRISGITLSYEWLEALKYYNLNKDDAKHILENSIRAAFCSKQDKNDLLVTINAYFNA